MQKIAEIKFKVTFEDKTWKMMTTKEISDLRDKRKWIVQDSKGKTILAKTFRGL